MIMVEGKLQSWGRAETVLKILDIDVAGKKLEATLEDIVEAVYNCGDRQSSLVYLQQECQCCFTYFPMSKVGVSNNATFMLAFRQCTSVLVCVKGILHQYKTEV